MGVERSGASVWDDAERRCELSFQMGNGEFPISTRYNSVNTTCFEKKYYKTKRQTTVRGMNRGNESGK